MTDVKSEALRYLGYRGSPPDEVTSGLLDKAYDELDVSPLSCSRIVPKADIGYLLRGDDIRRHLGSSDRVIVFAATLGSSVDRIIRTAEIRNMAYALILDALASALIEEKCDTFERELKESTAGYFTWRFSPGYGDYPIETQPDIIRFLNADKLIGLTVTENCILLPRKSVTALIGISDTEQSKGLRGCVTCSLRDSCSFRRAGNTCRG